MLKTMAMMMMVRNMFRVVVFIGVVLLVERFSKICCLFVPLTVLEFVMKSAKFLSFLLALVLLVSAGKSVLADWSSQQLAAAYAYEDAVPERAAAWEAFYLTTGWKYYLQAWWDNNRWNYNMMDQTYINGKLMSAGYYITEAADALEEGDLEMQDGFDNWIAHTYGSAESSFDLAGAKYGLAVSKTNLANYYMDEAWVAINNVNAPYIAESNGTPPPVLNDPLLPWDLAAWWEERNE